MILGHFEVLQGFIVILSNEKSFWLKIINSFYQVSPAIVGVFNKAEEVMVTFTIIMVCTHVTHYRLYNLYG